MPETLRVGSSGAYVSALQCFIGGLKVDGDFGPKTEARTEEWQLAHGLKVDGAVGPITWGKIVESLPLIKMGATGDIVRGAQYVLGLPVNGNFDSTMDAGTRAYQKAHGLDVDGKIGPQTWGRMLGGDTATVTQAVDYKQFSSAWGGIMYSNHGDKTQTIKSSGCGPTAAADVVATWYNPSYTPVTACNDALAHGFRSRNDGTSLAFFDWIATQYPFKSYKRSSSTDEVIAALQAGSLVVALMGPDFFTSGGHYILAKGYDPATDNILVNNPGSSTKNKATSKIFRSQSKAYFIYTR